MRDAHGRVGRVHALAAGPARAERVDAQILRIDLDVHFLGFRQHGDRRRRRVDAAARFGRRHALHAMHAALVLEAAVDALAFDRRDHFLEAADAGLADRQHVDLPAAAVPRSANTCGTDPPRTAPPRRRPCRRGFPARRCGCRSDPSGRAATLMLFLERRQSRARAAAISSSASAFSSASAGRGELARLARARARAARTAR